MNDLIQQIIEAPSGAAIKLIGGIESQADCAKARDAESAAKNRATVLDAIDKRFGELDGQPGEGDATAAVAGVVQLTCNAAGHLMGETFKLDDAQRLGILNRCVPFGHRK